MIFVIPVSGADFDKLPKFVKVLQKFGNLQDHKVIVVASQDVSKGAFEFTSPLSMMFGEYTEIKLNFPTQGHWPLGPNVHFQNSVSATIGLLDGPWMWLELDSCPLVKGWADAIQHEYRALGRPFMGVISNSSEFLEGASGNHMVGFGVYPPDFNSRTVLWNYPSPDVPFDIFMRDAIIRDVANTPKIFHSWGSRHYTLHHDGCLYGKDRHDNDIGIPPEAVIAHGVKDDSLYDFILGEGDLPHLQEEKFAANDSSLEQMADLLRKAGYFVVTPEAASQIIENSEDLISSPSTETISTQPDDLQGDPAMGHSLQPSETKAVVESNATKVQLPKRGRPRKLPV